MSPRRPRGVRGDGGDSLLATAQPQSQRPVGGAPVGGHRTSQATAGPSVGGVVRGTSTTNDDGTGRAPGTARRRRPSPAAVRGVVHNGSWLPSTPLELGCAALEKGADTDAQVFGIGQSAYTLGTPPGSPRGPQVVRIGPVDADEQQRPVVFNRHLVSHASTVAHGSGSQHRAPPLAC